MYSSLKKTKYRQNFSYKNWKGHLHPQGMNAVSYKIYHKQIRCRGINWVHLEPGNQTGCGNRFLNALIKFFKHICPKNLNFTR